MQSSTSGLLIPCPQCGSGLRLKDRSKLGKLGKCPKCGHKFVLHEPEEVELELETEGPAVGTGAQWVPDQFAPGVPPFPPQSFPQPAAFPSFDGPAEPAAAPAINPVVTPAGPAIQIDVADEPRTLPRPLVPQFEKGTPLTEVLQQLGKPIKRKVIAAPAPAPVPVGKVANGAKPAPQPVKKREYLLFEHPAGPYKLIFEDGQLVEIHSQPDATTLPPPAATPAAGRGRVSRRKKSQRTTAIVLGGLAAAAIMGIVFVAENLKSPADPPKPAKRAPQRSASYEASKADLATRFDAANDLAAQVVPPAGPLPMRMVPAGAAGMIHLHPAALWSDTPRFQEVRATLGPLAQWAAAEIERVTGFPPQQIDELSVYIYLPGQDVLPDYSAVVRLSQPLEKKSIFIEKFLGQMQPGTGYTRFDAPTRSYIVQDDLKTFAVGPPLYVDEIIGTMHTDQGAAHPGVDELRIHTDRARHFTLLFNRADVMLCGAGLVGESVRPLVDRAMDWLGKDVESAAWSFHVGESQFLSEFQFRVGHDWLPQELTRKMQQKLDRLPGELVAMARMMHPAQVGYRQIIGRFPAMMKLYSLKTIGGSAGRLAQLTTVLEERAAPNLMLAALLTWDESTRTDFTRAAPTPPTGGSKLLPETIAGRLKLPIDAEFNRVPLQDAFDYIADGTKLTIDIHGDALKFAGYTKNMPQTFNLGKVPAEQVIAKILSQYKEMCVVVRSEKDKKIEVMTYDFAKKEGLEPLTFPKPK